MRLARPNKRLFTTSTTIQKPKRVINSQTSMEATKELHAHLIRTEAHTDPFSISNVVKSYALSPATLHKTHLVFNQIQRPTLLVWNHMIRGLSLSDQPIEAIRMYHCIYNQGVNVDNLSLIYVFKACARVSDVVHGVKFHGHALKLGFGLYLYVGNALIHMYASCGCLDFAQRVFDEMSDKDLVSWNSLICGYSQCNRFREILGLFHAMQEVNVKGDSVTMVKVILACTYLGDRKVLDSMLKYIEENHVEVDVYLGNTLIDMYGRQGSVGLAREVFDRMRERNIVSWNAMIMAYAKAGDLGAARKLFDDMPKRDVISWTSMITGYTQVNQFTDAVRLFQEMTTAGVKADHITIASVLSACAHLGMLDVGEEVHNYIHDHVIKTDVCVGNALIDMYCKCGLVEKALEVFHEMKEKDNVSWTSVISGLAVNGFANSALELFSQMLRECFQPCHGTFIGVLLACAHAGLVDKGMEYFEIMVREYGLEPEMKHYGCVVDLLSRSGNLDRAYEFIKKIPIVPDVVIWRSLLSACKLHENLVLAEVATNRLLELDPSNSGNYVLSSSSYAGADKWDDAMKMRELMKEKDLQKPSGFSSVKINMIVRNIEELKQSVEKRASALKKTKDGAAERLEDLSLNLEEYEKEYQAKREGTSVVYPANACNIGG